MIDNLIHYSKLKSDNEISEYAKRRRNELDSVVPTDLIGLGSCVKEIKGWVNSKTKFAPSAFRSKGFNLDSDLLYIEWIKYIKETLDDIDLDDLNGKEDILSGVVLHQISTFILDKFGSAGDRSMRKKLYDGNLLQEPLCIDELVGKNVVRCIESSAVYNNVAVFTGMDSSIILTQAKKDEIETGHALCKVHSQGQHYLCEPSFWLQTTEGISPCIAYISEEALQKREIEIDIAKDSINFTNGEVLPEQPVIIYKMPQHQEELQ
ncbi:MAG TPA: hypothetical protein DEP72_02575 [Clostridiales bacterium]|nr:hypothetical protein [Clostridiales bacterium]